MSCGLYNYCQRASFQRCFCLQNMLLQTVAPPGIVQLLHWFLPTAAEFYRSFLCVPIYHICCISHRVSTNIFVKDDLFSYNEDKVDNSNFFIVVVVWLIVVLFVLPPSCVTFIGLCLCLKSSFYRTFLPHESSLFQSL